jgi:hypothetical protein
MPRIPKDPEHRQRRNKASTAATLLEPGESKKAAKIPPLNATVLGLKRGQGGVRPQVMKWWREAWSSPMASRWIATDVQVLYLCAQLHQQKQMFFEEGKAITTLAAEIARQEGRIGMDVMSRRRLDWRIEGPRQPDAQPAPEPVAPPAPESFDPRRVLRAVQ